MKVFATRVRGVARVLFAIEGAGDVVQCGLLVHEHGWDPAPDGCLVPLKYTNSDAMSVHLMRLAIRDSNDKAQALSGARAPRVLRPA